MKSSRSQSLHRSLELRGHASSMRLPDGNAAEQLLWQQLRAGQLGVWFRRQVVLGACIVDFYAPARKVVVEVDGGYHAEPARRRADARRDRRLAKAGFRVLRLPAELVLRHPQRATELVVRALAR